MSEPLPLIDAMTGETVGYEVRPGDDPIILGTCAVCAHTVWSDGEVILSGALMAHPQCARFGTFP